MNSGLRTKVLIHAQGTDRFVLTDKPSFVIGRAKDADVVLQADNISRRHTRISLEGRVLWVEDLGSSNGTWINDRKIEPYRRVPLKVTDRISFSKKDELYLTVVVEEKALEEPTRVYKVSNGPDLTYSSHQSQAKPLRKFEIASDAPAYDESKIFEQIKSFIYQGAAEIRKKKEEEGLAILREASDEAHQRIYDAETFAAEKLEELHHEEEIHNRRLREINDKCMQLTSEVQRLEAQDREINERIRQAQHNLTYERDRVAREKSEFEDLKKEIQSELAEVRKEVTQTREELKKLQSERDVVKEDIILLKMDIELLNENKKGAEAEASEARDNIIVAKDELAKIQLQKKQFEEDVTMMKREVELASYNLELTRKEASIITKENEKVRADLLEFEQELNKRDSESAAHLEEARLKASQLVAQGEAELSALIERQESAKQEFERVKAELVRRIKEGQDQILIDQKKGQEEAEKILEKAKVEALFVKDEAQNYATEIKQKSDQMLKDLKQEVFERQSEANRTFATYDEKRKLLEKELNELELNRQKKIEGLDRELKDLKLRNQKVSEAHRRELETELEEHRQSSLRELQSKFKEMTVQQEEEHKRKKQQFEDELKVKKENEENDLKEMRRVLEEELRDKKMQQEKNLAQMKEVEVLKLKEIRMKSETDWQDARQDRANAVASSVQALVKNEMMKAKAKTIDDKFIGSFSTELKELIIDIMLGRNGAQSQKLQDILKTNENSKAKEQALLLRLKVGAGALVTLSLVLIFNPGIWQGTKGFFSDLVSEKKNVQSDEYVKDRIAEARKRSVFSPMTTPEFKESYYENYLYTTDYLSIRNSKEFQDKWVLELNDYFINDLDVKDTAIIKFISLETALISDFEKMRSGINPQNPTPKIEEMRVREKEFKERLAKIFDDTNKVTRFYNFSEKFWNNFTKKK